MNQEKIEMMGKIEILKESDSTLRREFENYIGLKENEIKSLVNM